MGRVTGQHLSAEERQRIKEAITRHRESGGTATSAARELGIRECTVQKIAREMDRDPAIATGMEAVGTGIVPSGMWIKTGKDEDGVSRSIYLKPQQETTEDLIDRIASRVERILPAPAVKRPVQTASDLCNLFPLFDVHLSMRVGEYGTAAAVDRLREGAEHVMGRSPAAESCIILNGGDWSHQNDDSNQTPRSKHPLPVDGDYESTSDISTDLTVELIFRALERHDHVTYKALRGNHDPNTALILRGALRQRFLNEPRVTIDTNGIDFFCHPWRANLICGHHGDIRGKRPADIAMAFAALYPAEYSQAKHREIHSGHLHHLKSQEMPGWVWYQHRAICPMDRHAMEDLWVSGSEMTGITYHERGARYGQVTHIFN